MALSNTQYDQIKRMYDQKLLRRHYEIEKRTAYVNEHVEGYKELSDAISSLSIERARLLFEGNSHALDDLKESIELLRDQKNCLLKGAGLPTDYLDIPYDCEDCQDTGYVNGEKCHCFKQASISLLYDQSNLKEYLDSTDFSKVSDKYYQGQDLSHFKDSFEKSINFVKNFKIDYQNLCFYGTVGSGKSFLSGCIAKELLKEGNSVIYFSASALMDFFSKYAFDFKSRDESEEAYRDIYECDLLIIDDLGTEVTNGFSISRLFTCLNERHLRKKSIIISTNLSLEELRDRYSDRIFSRLTGNFLFCRMTGPDIRMM